MAYEWMMTGAYMVVPDGTEARHSGTGTDVIGYTTGATNTTTTRTTTSATTNKQPNVTLGLAEQRSGEALAAEVKMVARLLRIHERQDLVSDRVRLRCQLVAPPLVEAAPRFLADLGPKRERVLQWTAADLRQCYLEAEKKRENRENTLENVK